MPIKGKQIADNSISQEKLKIETDSIIYDTDATNKEYVDNVVDDQVSSVRYNKFNRNMTALNAGVGDLACNDAIIEFNLTNVRVTVNGVDVNVGPGLDCYFSPDDGITIREQGKEQKGDFLYWNSSKYMLDSSDEIDFIYLVAYDYLVEGPNSQIILDPTYNTVVVEYTGDPGTSTIVTIEDEDFIAGNVNGNFVWDIGGTNEHTFTHANESILQEVNGNDYTIWYDGEGSLIFSVAQGNFIPGNPFILKINVTAANFVFELPATGTNDFTVYWGDDTSEHVTTAKPTHTYNNVGEYTIYIKGSMTNFEFSDDEIDGGISYEASLALIEVKSVGDVKLDVDGLTFNGCKNLKKFNVYSHNVLNITDATNMFRYCSALTYVNTLKFTSVTIADSMFMECSKIRYIDASAFSSVVNAKNMFNRCVELVTLDNANFISVTNAYHMFAECNNLDSINTVQFKNVTDATSMFYKVYNIESINLLDFENLVNASRMFESTTLKNVNGNNNDYLTKLTNTDYMFLNATFEYIDFTLFQNVDSADSMFMRSNIKHLNLQYFKKLKNANRICYYAAELIDVDFGNDTLLLNDLTETFTHCTALTTVAGTTRLNDVNCYKTFNATSSLSNINFDIFYNATNTFAMFSHAFVDNTSITINSTFNNSLLTDVAYMFADSNISSLTIVNSFKYATTSTQFCYNCAKLISINVNGFNNLGYDTNSMFGYCLALKNIKLEIFNTNTQTTRMFDASDNVETFITNTSNPLNVKNISGLLRGKQNLTTVDLSGCTDVEYAYETFMNSGVVNGVSFPNPEKLLDVRRCFYNTNISNNVQELWNYSNIIEYYLCYGKSDNITNYCDIPVNWRYVECGECSNEPETYSFGYNNHGELGMGNTTDYNGAIQTPSFTNVKHVYNGHYYTFILFNDGTVKSFGDNQYGQLGMGNTTNYNGAIQTPSFTNVKQVSCGFYHTFILFNDGTVKSFGDNQYGQLGMGNETDYNGAIQTPSFTNVKQVSCGDYYTFTVFDDDTVKSFGYNIYGQLGMGNETDYNGAIQTPSFTNVKEVSARSNYTFILFNDGTVKSFGNNDKGQLGMGNETDYNGHIQTTLFSNIMRVYAGREVTFIICASNSAGTNGTSGSI